MIETIIEKTVGKEANIVCALETRTVGKYTSLDYKDLEFTNDLNGYFEPNEHGPQREIDMVVIDADNRFKVVKKHLKFSLKKSKFVVLANSLPPNRARFVTPEKRPGNWHGEVWKVVLGLNFIKTVDFVSFATGNGYTIVANGENEVLEESIDEINLSKYSDNRKKYARLVNADQLGEWYKKYK